MKKNPKVACQSQISNLAATPPEHLSVQAKQMWQAEVSFGMTAKEVGLLQLMLEAFDRAHECRSIINEDGLLNRSRRSGLERAHPLLKAELQNRMQYLRFFSALNRSIRRRPDEIDLPELAEGLHSIDEIMPRP